MAIQNLNASAPDQSALLPFYDPTLGADARGTITQFAALINAILGGSGGMVTQYAAPSATGFSVTVAPSVPGTSTFLLLTPGATYAAGTIVMPAAPSDKQEVLVHSTQEVTTLTVDGNGKTLYGEPSTLAAEGFARMRYDGVLGAWFRVG